MSTYDWLPNAMAKIEDKMEFQFGHFRKKRRFKHARRVVEEKLRHGHELTDFDKKTYYICLALKLPVLMRGARLNEALNAV